ncbi:MAG TPA: hypothetical protein VFA33_27900 [Bryobacteraceae bacterium]|nr:hypothetical protein [Bryobacteraceae bacterium]
MRTRGAPLLVLVCFVPFAFGQPGGAGQPPTIPLLIPPGTPLRLYLTRRISKRAGAPVEARLLEPLYAFDREVVPAGCQVIGRVSRVAPVTKSERAQAVLNGDFTPLHRAYFEFTELRLPDGRRLLIHTDESTGLDSIVSRTPPKSQPQNPQGANGGVLGTGKQKVEDQIHAQIARAKSIPDVVRGPDKKERVADFLMSKLPYHPQYVRKGTRFDAELRAPLDFGKETVNRGALALLGTQPPGDSLAHARLLTALDSGSSKLGTPVEAVLGEPLFSTDHRLILPEGTRLEGSVVLAKKARRFHRGGQLRFTFQRVELPPEVVQLEEAAPPAAAPSQRQEKLRFRTEATLKAIERGKAPLKVDGEGGVEAKESKTRFLGTAAAVMIARRAGDNDPVRAKGTHTVVGQQSNVAGRTVGGGFGFGLLGAGIAQSSRWVGAAFGYYGMAWSVYSTVISRGAEVRFEKNAVVDIGFNTRQQASAAKAGHNRATPGSRQ